MTKEEKIREIDKSRRQLIQYVNMRFDVLIKEMENPEAEPEFIMQIPLKGSEAILKGKKPVSVVMADGREISAPTWKRVDAEILKDCNADKERHIQLMNLREILCGRKRKILSASAEQMSAPLKIDDGLYFEGKFDTEYLITVLTKHVLSKVGYDYENILVKYRI